MFVIFMALLWNQTFPELIDVFIYFKNAGIQPFFFSPKSIDFDGPAGFISKPAF